MTLTADFDWRILMEATIMPPAERLPLEMASVERARLRATPECECPDACLIDHETD
jgi:hypothetical protein